MKHKHIVVMLTLAVLAISKSFAQTDTTYIASFDKDFAVQVFSENKFITLSESEYNKKNEIEYISNKPIDIGVGFTWRSLSLSASYSLGFASDPKRGKTESFDFQYHRYAKNYVWDVYLLRYKGLYTEDNEITIYPSVKIIQIGSSGQYVFNHNKFSYRATFGQREKQIKSAGSFILGGGFFYNRLDSYKSRISYEELNLQSLQLGINGGYAYTWAFHKNAFITGSLTGGASVGSVNQNISLKNLNAYPNITVRMAAGYNGKDWTVGFAFLNNIMEIVRSQNHDVTLNTGSVRLNFIKRFSSNKVFGKNTDKINNLYDKVSDKISFFIPN